MRRMHHLLFPNIETAAAYNAYCVVRYGYEDRVNAKKSRKAGYIKARDLIIP